MDFKQYYEGYWDRDTDVSDHDVTTPERRRRLLANVARHCQPGDPVLDLGCGAGSFTAALRRAGFGAVGYDLSARAVAMARHRHPECRFGTLNPDGSIPEPDGQFAAVWSSEVIEHVLDVRAFLREINRAIRPGGILILTTPYHGLAKNLLVTCVKFDQHFDVEDSHIRFFDRRGLDRTLGKAGFRPLSYGGVGRVWPVYRSWFVVARKAA
jgi:2-polyprenyl-3-methyl-5-hydroxy-6-metoxy-1,4-benzoquinol methylase